jgi:hypothetical protein
VSQNLASILSIPRLRYLVSLRHWLVTSGAFASFETRRPVAGDGQPIPWFTYPAIAFLEKRVRPEWRVCEFGSGQSTLWWSARVTSVLSIEHDRNWYREFSPRVGPRVTYVCHPKEEEYAAAIVGEGPFDVIVNDGIGRLPVVMHAVSELSPAGVIVWDNSERPEYEPGYRFLRERGFRRIDFSGFGPVNQEPWCTAVFYRVGNCLGI